MCIIAAKPAGIKMPARNVIENMWMHNSDGAGIMYTSKGRVRIEKGFMTYDAFTKHLDELSKKIDLDKISVVMHFRITTHGGTKPENCHPFPVTDSIGMLKKLTCETRLGVAHNGVIDIAPRKDISDTMEYIASQLAPLYKGVPKFYENKHLMQMVSNAIDSKMAFLLPSGKIYTIGDFVEKDGIMYSNHSFEYTTSFRDYKSYAWDDERWLALESGMRDYSYKNLMWLDDTAGDFAMDEKGELWTGDFAVDVDGFVYEYDGIEDAMTLCPGWRAYNAEGMTLTYDERSQLATQELVLSEA